MNTKVNNALGRLNKILPLAEHQQSLSEELADVYQKILYSYVESGKTLNRNEIGQHVNDLDESIRILKDNDMVVFDCNGEPVGAYPFTMEQRKHEVSISGHKVHCMCALDALAVSPMFGLETTINSRCHVTSEPICIHQRNREIFNLPDAIDFAAGFFVPLMTGQAA
jgi:mercuric reductase